MMRDINLLPGVGSKSEKQRQSLGKYLIAGLLLIIPIGYLAYDMLLVQPQLSKITDQLAETVVKTNTYREAEPVVNERNAFNERLLRMTVLKMLTDQTEVLNTQVMDEIRGVMPEEVFSVTYSMDENARILLTCKSRTDTAVAGFLHELKRLPAFNNVFISGIAKNKAENGTTQDYSFNISMEYANEAIEASSD